MNRQITVWLEQEGGARTALHCGDWASLCKRFVRADANAEARGLKDFATSHKRWRKRQTLIWRCGEILMSFAPPLSRLIRVSEFISIRRDARYRRRRPLWRWTIAMCRRERSSWPTSVYWRITVSLAISIVGQHFWPSTLDGSQSGPKAKSLCNRGRRRLSPQSLARQQLREFEKHRIIRHGQRMLAACSSGHGRVQTFFFDY